MVRRANNLRTIILIFCSVLFLSCSNKLEEIPLNEIPEDFNWASHQTAKNILEFCSREDALKEFNLRSAIKARMQTNAGKHFLTCLLALF